MLTISKKPYAWIDVALRVLRPLGWSPECWDGLQNVEEMLLPENSNCLSYIGSIAERDEQRTGAQADFGNWDTQISAHFTATVVGTVEVARRNLYVRGKILAEVEIPAYHMEVAVVHAIRALHDWTAENQASTYEVNSAVIHAGDIQLNAYIAQWFKKGTLGMRSAAASLLARGPHDLHQ